MFSYVYRFVTWQGFFYSLQVAVLVDALLQAFACGLDGVYGPAQIFFTLLFDVEFILKLIGMGFRGNYIHQKGNSPKNLKPP